MNCIKKAVKNIKKNLGYKNEDININGFSNNHFVEELGANEGLYELFANVNCVYDKEEMMDLKYYTVPEVVLGFYSHFSLKNNIDLGGDVNLLSYRGIIRENSEFAPGAFLIKYSLLTFAKTTGGNAICIDLNEIKNKEPRVVIADHSIFSSKTVYMFKNGKRSKEDLSYAVISKYANEICSKFSDFIIMLADGKIEDVESYMN